MINRFFTEFGSCYTVYPDNTIQRLKRYPDGHTSLQPRTNLTIYINGEDYYRLVCHVKFFKGTLHDDVFKFTNFTLTPEIGRIPFDLFIPSMSSEGGYFWRLNKEKMSLSIGGLRYLWKNGPHYHIGHKIIHIE